MLRVRRDNADRDIAVGENPNRMPPIVDHDQITNMEVARASRGIDNAILTTRNHNLPIAHLTR
jgi:hypothetical protein